MLRRGTQIIVWAGRFAPCWHMNSRQPKASIAIPVFNDEASIGRTIESVLAQTMGDVELVITDNASEDGVEDICRSYAKADDRIRYFRHPRNIGLLPNFNYAFEQTTGEYIRWLGCGDWLAPEYLDRCSAALDRQPEAVLATCYQDHYDPDGTSHYIEYTGPRVESSRPDERFARMLWFYQVSRFYLDPIYSLIRRSALERTALFQSMLGSDQVLAIELSLLGPFCHVPECLSFRNVPPNKTPAQLLRRLDPAKSDARWWMERMYWKMASFIAATPMSPRERFQSYGAWFYYFQKAEAGEMRNRARDYVKSLLRRS